MIDGKIFFDEAIDLSKPQALYADPKEVQQIQSSTLLQI